MRWDGSLSSILVSLCSLRVGMVTDKPMTVSQGSTDVSNGHRYPRQLQFGCFSHFLLCSKRDGMWLFLWWREINGALWAGGNSYRHFKQRCHLVTVRWPHYSTHTLSEADRRTVGGTKHWSDTWEMLWTETFTSLNVRNGWWEFVYTQIPRLRIPRHTKVVWVWARLDPQNSKVVTIHSLNWETTYPSVGHQELVFSVITNCEVCRMYSITWRKLPITISIYLNGTCLAVSVTSISHF